MSAFRDALVAIKNIGKLSERQLKNVEEAVRVTQAAVVNEAKRNHPYTDRTENLTNSIQPGQIKVGFIFISGEVRADADYAEFVEFGTSVSRPFPFMVPAMLGEISNFRQRVANAMRL